MSVKYMRDNLAGDWDDEGGKGTDGASEKLRVRMEADSYNSTDQMKDSLQKRDSSPSRHSKRTVCSLCVIVLLLLIIIGVLAGLLVWRHLQRSKSVTQEVSPCTSVDCVRTAASLLSSMDLKADPCTDFYQYACGAFLDNPKIPPDKVMWGSFAKVAARNNRLLLKVLQQNGSEYKGQDSSAVRKSREHFASCMNTTAIEKKGIEPALKLIRKCGSWPLTSDPTGGSWMEAGWSLEASLAAVRRHGGEPLFKVHVATDMKDSNKTIIGFDQGGLTFTSPLMYSNKTHLAFVDLLVNVAKLLGSTVNVTEMAEDAWNLELRLANAFVPAEERVNQEKNYHKMSLAELQKMMPSINLNLLLHELYGSVIPDSEQVMVLSPEYLQRMSDIVKDTPKATLATYTLWRLLPGMLLYLPQSFLAAVMRFNAAVLGTSRSPPRDEFCVENTGNVLGFAVGTLFVRERFGENDKSRMSLLLHEIRASLESRLPHVNWMDAKTRQLALTKARAITQFIGYPEYIMNVEKLDKYYQDLNIDRNELFQNVISYLHMVLLKEISTLGKPADKLKWEMMPADVNAYYQPATNKIVFPAGILQAPFYDQAFPMSLNFGAVGMVMGHELMHAFDNSGRRFDQFGNLNNWWTDESARKFEKRAGCLRKQYGDYRIQGHRVRSQLTLGEDIADNGGIIVAYDAYVAWASRSGDPEPTLPALNLTSKQLFFLGFAQLWCSYYTPKYAVEALYLDVHSPTKYRVIGSLSNLPQFSEVFSCPVDSPMNRGEQRCTMW